MELKRKLGSDLFGFGGSFPSYYITLAFPKCALPLYIYYIIHFNDHFDMVLCDKTIILCINEHLEN